MFPSNQKQGEPAAPSASGASQSQSGIFQAVSTWMNQAPSSHYVVPQGTSQPVAEPMAVGDKAYDWVKEADQGAAETRSERDRLKRKLRRLLKKKKSAAEEAFNLQAETAKLMIEAANKEAELADKKAELDNKKAELDNKKTELANKEAELANKEAEDLKIDKDVEEIQKQLQKLEC